MAHKMGTMEWLCEGPFWNSSSLVHNTWPQFTDCFVHTVLIWIPCAFLFLALPYYVTSVQSRATHVQLQATALFGARLCVCLTLSVLSLLHVGMRTRSLTVSTSPAAYLGDVLYITCYLTLCMMTQYERRKGVHASSVPFFFWLVTSLCNIVPIYTMVLQETYFDHPVSCMVLLLSYSLQLCSLVLTAFVRNEAPCISRKSKRPCPIVTCSYPSFLTFWWMTKLMVTGYQRELEDTDMWSLPNSETSSRLMAKFSSLWSHTPRTDGARGDNPRRGSGVTELSPLLASAERRNAKPQPRRHDDNSEGDGPSLLRTMLRLLWKDCILIFVLKLLSDLLFLACPVLLGVLMTYIKERPEGREWQGVVLCVGMFGSLLLKSLLFAHAMFHAARLGIRMKSTLISSIYNKALTMSNSTKQWCSTGEIVNLMSVDAQRVQDVMIVCFFASTTPIQFCVAVGLLYLTIGPAIFVGVLLLLCLVPLNAFVVSRQRHLQSNNLKFKDARIRLYNEILNGIKVLKLYAWEPSFREKIREIRLREVGVLFKMAVLNTVMGLCWELAPFLVTLVSFATYVLTDSSHRLDPAMAFVSLALFNVLRPPLALLSKMVMYVILVQVSLKRIRTFLVSDDLDPDAVEHRSFRHHKPAISIQTGTFRWNSQLPPTLHDINLEVGEGRLVAVVGPVGCGKSSLISAMLGEMEKVKGKVVSRGRVAYVPQQAWIQNATVRDNILFGKPLNRSKYRRVLDKCQLERDLTILSAGDNTEIGEKGINLSGGQKQRVSVARAVYSDCDVYLLDDPLSAVDSHVGKAIFNHVIGPHGLLSHTTRVLVTHGVHWLPMVDEIIVMQDGTISERGSYEQLVSHDGPFAQFLKTYLTEDFEVQEEQVDPEIAEIHGRMRKRLESVSSYPSSEDDSLKGQVRRRANVRGVRREGSVRFREAGSEVEDSLSVSAASDVEAGPCGSLNTSEIVSKGRVSASVFCYYIKAVGVVPLLLAFLCFTLFQGLSVGANYWLKEWTRNKIVSSHLDVMSSFNTTDVMSSLNATDFMNSFNSTDVMNSFNSTDVTSSFNTTDVTTSVNTTADMSSFNTTDVTSSLNTTDIMSGGNATTAITTHEVVTSQEVMTTLRTVLNDAVQAIGDGLHDTQYYLTVYGLLGIGQAVFLLAFNVLHWTRMAVAARALHARLADSLLHAPMSFFDTTPSGRVLNRVSFDVETVDSALPIIVKDWLITFALVLVTMMVMVIQTPWSGLVLLPLTVLYYYCQRFYVPTALQLRRMECVTRTPIYVLFGETLSGADSIRAFDVTQRFLEESKVRVDSNQVYFFAYQASIRWMQWYLDFLSAFIVLAACVFTVLDVDTDPADAGLCISYALQVSGALTWMTRQISDFQTNIVSVERLKEYSELDTEAEWEKPEQKPPPSWPQKGEVTFNNYQTRYREGLELVLRGVTCTIRDGEKVGIVGRTGAGKSSLTLSLFRLIEAAGGSIAIDGVDIAHLGLHDLRTHLTILPQDPVLFSGTLRMNLDPFDEFEDSQLWTALDRAHLRHAVTSLPGQLAFQCGEEGANLSVGQRQLVCLARTLLRRTKILVLDEATAAVDMETDALIQNTIRSAFSSCTVITIAHRLNTIMDYDRVLVMDHGRIKEFAAPEVLLSDKSSAFFAMARDAGLVTSP